MKPIQLHDMVALTLPLPEHGLRRGEVGVVIDLGPNDQYLLEFADRNGVPYAMPTVLGDRLLKVFLHADPFIRFISKEVDPLVNVAKGIC